MKKQGALVMLTKHPFVGQVKTRLAKYIGKEKAADLSWAMVQDTLMVFNQVEGVKTFLAMDGPCRSIHSYQGVEVIDQGQGSFGDRLQYLALSVLKEYAWVIIVGSDCPHMPVKVLTEAIGWMKQGKNILGPTEDGGYYIQGLQACPDSLYQDIPWSTSSTFMRMFESHQSNLEEETEVLTQLFDIDQPEDLLKLKNQNHLKFTQKMICQILS